MDTKHSETKPAHPVGEPIKITIDLGTVKRKPTPEEVSRLKALVRNDMLTWVKDSLSGDEREIVFDEFMRPVILREDDAK